MSKYVLYTAQRVSRHCFEIREWVHTVQKQISKFRGVMYLLSIRTIFLGIAIVELCAGPVIY